MNSTYDNKGPPDLEQYRSSLRLLAELQLNPQLKVREDTSDIAQQTMLEAHRDFAGFCGKSESELRASLNVILMHNLLSVAKHYGRDKRTAGREFSLQDQLEQSSALLHRQLVADQTSPGMKLLDDERSAVILKHYHRWSVVESLNTSAGLRKLWPDYCGEVWKSCGII